MLQLSRVLLLRLYHIYQQKKNADIDDDDVVVPSSKSLLQIIKDKTNGENGVNLNDEIISNMLMFFPASLTISPTILHLFSLLLENQEFLGKIVQEQQEFKSQNGNTITSTALK